MLDCRRSHWTRYFVRGEIECFLPTIVFIYDRAAKLGVTKINIDTDGRLVRTRVHQEFFRDKPAEFDFRPPGITFMDEYAKCIAHKNTKLGSAGELPAVRAALGGKE